MTTPITYMTENDITRAYLAEHGFDGLSEPYYLCSCGLNDLFICDRREGRCEPAYKRENCKGCPSRDVCENADFNEGCYSSKWGKNILKEKVGM